MKNKKIAIIGLGYVGLPLAVSFGQKLETKGFDINKKRIAELEKGIDVTLETRADELRAAVNLSYTDKLDDLKDSDIYIVTVPTPIDEFKRPDLSPLISASTMIGKVISKGNIVIYESTVYPGCTEEDCVPVLENFSGLKFNKDFFCGYSPERINPGDKEHRLETITKVTSGSTPEIAIKVDELYKSIIKAGTHLASSIKVAEAAKIIENSQRDLNIAFVNELALICDKLEIDTLEVIEAAATKWNFLKFYPGLVGGHCIGVDPYYLTHKAQGLGYHPEVLLSGRRVNDNMEYFVAGKMIKLMIKKGLKIRDAKVLILGLTFKENCPDIRNTRVINIINELKDFGANVDIYDPWADKDEVKEEYNLELIETPNTIYDGILLAVSHREFLEMNIEELRSDTSVIFDVKGVLPKSMVDGRL